MDAVQHGSWEYEPGEVPGLLALARDRWKDQAPRILQALAERERAMAAQIRAVQRETEAAEADALAIAALPSDKVLGTPVVSR